MPEIKIDPLTGAPIIESSESLNEIPAKDTSSESGGQSFTEPTPADSFTVKSIELTEMKDEFDGVIESKPEINTLVLDSGMRGGKKDRLEAIKLILKTTSGDSQQAEKAFNQISKVLED